MDRTVCLSKTSSGQVFTISDKINVSLTSLNQKKVLTRIVDKKKKQKKASPEGLHVKNIQSIPTFLSVGTLFFFCSVNRAQGWCYLMDKPDGLFISQKVIQGYRNLQSGLKFKKIPKSPFSEQLEKYSRQMQIFSRQFV